MSASHLIEQSAFMLIQSLLLPNTSQASASKEADLGEAVRQLMRYASFEHALPSLCCANIPGARKMEGRPRGIEGQDRDPLQLQKLKRVAAHLPRSKIGTPQRTGSRPDSHSESRRAQKAFQQKQNRPAAGTSSRKSSKTYQEENVWSPTEIFLCCAPTPF